MGTVVTTDVVNGTTIDAGVVNANFSAVKAQVNGNIENSNVSASAGLSVSKLAAGSNNDVLTTVAGVPTWQAPAAGSSASPTGGMMMYGGASAPSGWLLCDGTAVSRTTYSALFTAIGTTYGAGDGSTTFNVPDLRGRVPVGLSSSGPSEVNALGDNDGRSASTRNISHYHTIQEGGGGTGVPVPTASAGSSSPVNTSGDANNLNYPAYLVVNYIIKT